MNAFDTTAYFLKRVEVRHDPEADIGPVTWADMDLVEAIRYLSNRVTELERIVEQLDPRLVSERSEP